MGPFQFKEENCRASSVTDGRRRRRWYVSAQLSVGFGSRETAGTQMQLG